MWFLHRSFHEFHIESFLARLSPVSIIWVFAYCRLLCLQESSRSEVFGEITFSLDVDEKLSSWLKSEAPWSMEAHQWGGEGDLKADCAFFWTFTMRFKTMRSTRRVLKTTLLTAFGALFYCEFLMYYLVLWQCSYPQHVAPEGEETVTSMILADTHLLGSR